MFFILDLLHVAYLATATLVSMAMFSTQSYPLPSDFMSVTYAELTRNKYLADDNGECLYQTAVVPYARDWEKEETTESGRTVFPPEPDILIGYAVIAYKKICAGKVKPLLMIGDIAKSPISSYLSPAHLVPMFNYDLNKPDSLPKWMDQVTTRLELRAITNTTAKEALHAIKTQGESNLELIIVDNGQYDSLSRILFTQPIDAIEGSAVIESFGLS